MELAEFEPDQRTTSAFAESSMRSPRCSCGSTDHLRLRGELTVGSALANVITGPPPPSRRAPRRCLFANRRSRITSAFAESSTAARPVSVCCPDHLRLRGELPGA